MTSFKYLQYHKNCPKIIDSITPIADVAINPYLVTLSQGCFNVDFLITAGAIITADSKNKHINDAKNHQNEGTKPKIRANVIPKIGIDNSRALAIGLFLSNLKPAHVRLQTCKNKNSIENIISILKRCFFPSHYFLF